MVVRTRLPPWRRSADRTGLRAKFPGIREFYREFRDFGAQRHDLAPRNPCAAATSRAIPYADYQRKFFEEQRIFKRYQGFTAQERDNDRVLALDDEEMTPDN